MIKIEHIETFGFMAALRGMRNAMNSWHLQDSTIENGVVKIGENDLKLLLNLTKAGESHRKVLRMMHIQMDVTAPLYWWKDYDTYKVSTVANSCSTMHKIHAKKFTLGDFSTEHLMDRGLASLRNNISELNYYRDMYIHSGLKDEKYWLSMIQLLGTNYMQKRTLDINYETALKIIQDRRNHKLYEFRILCQTFIDKLPYMEKIYLATQTQK